MIYFFNHLHKRLLNIIINRLINAKAKIKHRKIQIGNLQDTIASERESS